MTAYADIEGAMNAVGEGAYDYLAKPIEPTELKRMVGEAIARRKLAAAEPPAPTRADAQAVAQIVGTTPAMLTVYKTVAHVAPTTATVLIVGESGTGKELVARAIHAKSPRATKPFVAINCGALPESILESELFGHERGSFTGASAQKRGLFEEAKGGTLFLDEIGEISPKMQVQLLRVLQEGEIRRVGAAETIKVDVRVVAASNRDLKGEVAAGRFREDLLFRLQVVTVIVPPLRERRGDMSLLIKHFIGRHAARLGRPAPHVAPEVFEMLEAYEFPGNVRELIHIIERAMLLAREGVITATDLPPEVTRSFTRAGGRRRQHGHARRRLAHAPGARAALHRPRPVAHRGQQDARRRRPRHRPAHAQPHVRARARLGQRPAAHRRRARRARPRRGRQSLRRENGQDARKEGLVGQSTLYLFTYSMTGSRDFATSSRLAMLSCPSWCRYSTCAPASSSARIRE